MTRAILVVWLALLPLGASAQVQGDEDAASAAPPPALQTTPQTRQPAPPPPPPDLDRPRRRGSMVGYIEDATVGSKLRVRFDSGWEINAPDRAEFFYAKCGCYRDEPPGTAGFDPEAPGPGPGAAIDLNYRQLYILGEYAVNDRFSAYAEFPFRWLSPQDFAPASLGFGALTPFGDQSGFSDLRAGVKIALVSDEANVVTGRVQFFMPTGEALEGLGTDHASIEPSLLLYNRLNDRVVLESMFGWWHPFEGAAGVPAGTDEKWAGDVIFYGIGPSFEVYQSDRVRFGPVVELVGWRVLDGFQSAPPFPPPTEADGVNIVNLKIGGRVLWQPGHSLYVGFGKALTDDFWYDQILRVEYRVTF